MNNAQPQLSADDAGRNSQIVVAALMMGQVVFGAVTLTMDRAKLPGWGIISTLGAGMAGMLLVLSFVLPAAMTRGAVRGLSEQPPADRREALASVYQSKVLAANALREGAGMMNLVAFLLEGHWISLAIVGALLATMAITFPSQMKFESWAEQIQRDNS